MSELRTDFKDDVLDVTQNEKRKYRIIHNDDGTISLEDATVYLQQGDSFGANDLNEMNRMANQMNEAAGEILTMADDIDTLQEDVEALEGNTDILSSDVETLKNTIGYTHNPSSKNLLEITAPSKTSNGITFTVNNDGSVTANGTSTSVAVIDVNTNIYLPNGEYILSGCPKGGSADTYYIAVNGGSGAVNTSDKGDGTSFSINDYTLDRVRVWINVGQTVNNLTFYPMIRKADVTDDTYEPYVNDSVDVRLNNILEDLKWKEIFSFEKAVSSSTSSISLSNGTSYPTVDITPYSELMIKCKYYANNQWYPMKKDARIFVLSTDDYIGNNKSIPTPYSTSGDGSITRSSEKVFTAWNFGASYNGATMSLKIYGRKNIL